jgi:copper chaperone CopZ
VKAMENGVFVIKDMVNQQDADKVLNALLEVWGIGRAEVNLNKSNAVFSYDERMASYHDFEQAVIDTGYEILQTGRSSLSN